MTPRIVLCDNDKDLSERLIFALREAHGTTARVFVRDSKTETLVVLLPGDGPSLAEALRDWVQDWWSDGDNDQYGSPEQYLAGFGVVIPTSEWAGWSTSCPYCGTDDQLSVVSGTFEAMGMPLSADGFSTADAQSFNTDEVQIACGACQREFSIDEVAL